MTSALVSIGQRTLPIYVIHMLLLAALHVVLIGPMSNAAADMQMVVSVVEPVVVTATVVWVCLLLHRILPSPWIFDLPARRRSRKSSERHMQMHSIARSKVDMYSRRHPTLWIWAMAVAVVTGAGAAFAAVTTGETQLTALARTGDQAPTLTGTTTSRTQLAPIMPFNAKLIAHDIPVPGGGVRIGGCSGALIAPEWVITAGHCFHDGDHVPREGKPRSTVTVTLGKLKDSDPGGHTAEVIDVRQSPVNDIALARLATAVPDIDPLTLPAGPPTVGQQLEFAGWGSLSATVVAPSDHLKRGRFAVLEVGETTLEADSVVPRTVENSPCPQDSGAPFFVSTDHRTGVLVAVESTGPPCPQPGRETISRVDVAAEWIRQQTGINAP